MLDFFYNLSKGVITPEMREQALWNTFNKEINIKDNNYNLDKIFDDVVMGVISSENMKTAEEIYCFLYKNQKA